jgi:regulator of protease activity HflC (stomatin/prohibitin superfamily)
VSVTERQQRILVAIDVLVDARVEDVMAAVDSLSDDEAELDFWVRDRIRIALGPRR